MGARESRTNIKPDYQRSMCWSFDTMCGLLATIMNNGIIPNFTVYNYRAEDPESEKYDWEIIDGQHRMNTINWFVKSVKVTLSGSKGFIPFVRHVNKSNGEATAVFYVRTADTDEFFEEIRHRQGLMHCAYFTETEKRYFDRYKLFFCEIDCRLEFRQRQAIFDSLQNGEKNRNSDLLKNKVSTSVIKYFEDKRYVIMMMNEDTSAFRFCTKKAYKYSVQWLVRFLMLFTQSKSEAGVFNLKTEAIETRGIIELLALQFTTKDSEIAKMIKGSSIHLNVESETLVVFGQYLDRYFAFLEEVNGVWDIRFNPTHFFAIFAVLCQMDFSESSLSNLRTHAKKLSALGTKGSKYKTMWEVVDRVDERRDYFKQCLRDITQKCNCEDEEPERKQISKKMRSEIWRESFGECKIVRCPIMCGNEITEKTCHVAHLIPFAMGGLTVRENLAIICARCNARMGCKPMDQYVKEVHGNIKTHAMTCDLTTINPTRRPVTLLDALEEEERVTAELIATAYDVTTINPTRRPVTLLDALEEERATAELIAAAYNATAINPTRRPVIPTRRPVTLLDALEEEERATAELIAAAYNA